MNYKADKETYSKLIERNENFRKSCDDERKIYVARYTHDGIDSAPGYDKRYSVYEVVNVEVSTGKLWIKKIASNIKVSFLPWCKYMYGDKAMKIVR